MEGEQPIEKPEEEPKEPSVLEERGFQDFVEFRKISPEDFETIEKLSHHPKESLILELHNLFNLSHERSEQYLESRIEQLEELIKETKNEYEKSSFEEKKALLESFLKITEKYGWEASFHLERLLEERETEK